MTSESSPGPSPLLALRDLVFRYEGERDAPGFALAIESLDIERAQTVACIGPSGSGKTTLINLLTGIIAPEQGSVHHGEFAISDASEAERRAWRIANVGMVFQELELLEYLSALDNILLPYAINPGFPMTSDARDRAATLAEQMGVVHTLRRKPSRLSQGERQRIAICRALVTDPDLVVCDEPTGNLDPTNVARTMDLLFQHVADRGRTMIMVTHDHGVLDRFDRVVRMEELVANVVGGTS